MTYVVPAPETQTGCRRYGLQGEETKKRNRPELEWRDPRGGKTKRRSLGVEEPCKECVKVTKLGFWR